MNAVNPSGSDAPPAGGEPPTSLPNTALALGIAALVAGWLLAIAGALVGLAAMITGVMGLSQVRQGRAAGRNRALTSIVTGSLGIVTTLVVNAFFLLVGGGP